MAEPRLPKPPKPGKAMPRRFWSRSLGIRTTLFVAVSIVVVAVALAEMRRAPSAPDDDDGPETPTHHLPFLELGGTFMGLVVVSLVVLQRRARRFNRENREAIDLLRRGDLDGAGARFEALRARRWPLQRHFTGIVSLNCGVVALRKGEFDRALSLFGAALDAGVHGQVAQLLAHQLTTLSALRGDLDDAAGWLAQITSAPPPRVVEPALPEAILGCRRGEHRAVATRLEESWREIDNSLQGEAMRQLRIVRALAISAQGPREGGGVDGLLAGCKPFVMGEYDFLATQWPEMAMFLQAHVLSRGQAS